MLGKLLKHEFRATGRVMLPLYLVLLVMGVCGNVATRVMEHSESQFLNLLSGLTVVAFVVLMIAVSLMSFWLMISRFHKNLLTDEGYLMFTLPVSVHSLILSKIIVSTVWFIATALVNVLALVVLVFELNSIKFWFGDLGYLLDQLTTYYALNGAAIFLEFLVLTILGCAALCLLVYASAALGHSFANHKILLSFVFFFGFNWATQFIGIGGMMAVDDWNLNFAFLENWSAMAVTHFMFACMIAVELIYCAIFYVITAIALQKRLNLE